MSRQSRFLTWRGGPIFTGAVIGILAPLLVTLGNPGNNRTRLAEKAGWRVSVTDRPDGNFQLALNK